MYACACVYACISVWTHVCKGKHFQECRHMNRSPKLMTEVFVNCSTTSFTEQSFLLTPEIATSGQSAQGSPVSAPPVWPLCGLRELISALKLAEQVHNSFSLLSNTPFKKLHSNCQRLKHFCLLLFCTCGGQRHLCGVGSLLPPFCGIWGSKPRP